MERIVIADIADMEPETIFELEQSVRAIERKLGSRNISVYTEQMVQIVRAAVRIATNAERARDIAVGALAIAIAHGKADQGEMRKAA